MNFLERRQTGWDKRDVTGVGISTVSLSDSTRRNRLGQVGLTTGVDLITEVGLIICVGWITGFAVADGNRVVTLANISLTVIRSEVVGVESLLP